MPPVHASPASYRYPSDLLTVGICPVGHRAAQESLSCNGSGRRSDLVGQDHRFRVARFVLLHNDIPAHRLLAEVQPQSALNREVVVARPAHHSEVAVYRHTSELDR